MEVPLVLTASIILALFSKIVQCCGPAEIDQTYSIKSSTSDSSGVKVVWQFPDGTVLYNNLLHPSPNIYPNFYKGTISQLSIIRVTKQDGTRTFQHIVNQALVYTCALPVYKTAKNPACENITLTGNQIRTKCTTAQVFPKAKCLFTLNGEDDRKVVADEAMHVTYNHVGPQSGGNEYYSTSCILQYSVDGLKPGYWTVQVNMYPGLTGLSLANSTVGRATNTLQLSVPTVNINSTTCPKELAGEGNTINVRQGYIRRGERASCECARAHAGNPPGTVDWRSTHGGNFDILSQSEGSATIQINSPDTFTCKSLSVLDGSHSATYTPKYAYGPSSASLTFQRPGPIYLCPNQQTNIDISCQVPANSFSPETLFTIKDGSNNIVVKQVAGDGALYKTFNYNFTKYGQHTFTCRVENAIFTDIFSEAQASAIEVYEPPKDPPVIIARSAQYGDILVEGDDVTVTCDASGGYPSVESVTLTCNHSTSITSNKTLAKLTLNNIGLEYNETNCTCQATHVTGCYDLMGVLPLTITESNLTISEQEDSLPIGAAVGGAIGAFVVIAVVVGGIFFIRRRMRKKGHPSPEAGGPYDPYQDPIAGQLPVSAKDYTKVKPTIQSATALPKKYNPENADNPYEDVTSVELNRKSYAKTSQTKPVPGAQPKAPKTSVKTNAVLKPGKHVRGNPSRDSDYAIVVKRKSEHFMSLNLEQTDGSSTDGAAGGMPKIPERHYEQEEVKDLEDGKKKKMKEKPGKKEKEKKEKNKKDKNERKKKEKDKGMDLVGQHTNGNGEAGSSQDDDRVYSNEAVDLKTDGELYANIGTTKKSSSDVDDGRYTNDTGLVYITLQGVRTAIHHPRKETSVDYADIDYNQIAANREDMAQ